MALLIAAAIAIPLIVASAFLIVTRSGGQSEPSAVIVDQLSLTFPNQKFVERATDLLEHAGYATEYYSGEQVTVDFYRELPSRGYDLIILRVHSARLLRRHQTTPGDDVHLFTSEPYSLVRYDEEQTAERLSIASYEDGSVRNYFGIAPSFVESSMKGSFDDALIIMMGCDALRSDRMAQAFVDRGAAEVIGWDGPVSATHTDAATERLLQYLLTEGLPVAEAVAGTMSEVGPDPSYGSSLALYPPEEASLALP